MFNKKNELGQNFLTNKYYLLKIVKLINPKKKQILLEIGGGKGEITKNIIKYSKNLIVTEIDPYLIQILKKNIKKQAQIINKDFLKINLFKIFNLYKKKIRIFGNIPYNISKKIIFKLIKYKKIIYDIHIMVQKEFAYSLISKKGEKKYSKTTILTNLFYKTKILMYVDKKNFYPIPKINSVFISMKPKKNKYKLNTLKTKQFVHILNNSFIKRRKKIKNSLKNIINIKVLQKNGIDTNLRADNLSINQYCLITNLYNKITLKKQNKIIQ